MNVEKIFKRIILADVFICIFSLIAEMFSNTEGQMVPISILLIGLFLVIAYFFNLYLLYKFNPIGKTIFIPLSCLLIGVSFAFPLEPPSNYLSFLLGEIGPIFTGLIIAFIYFTDISKKLVSK